MRDFLCSLLSGYFLFLAGARGGLFNKIWIMVEWIFARRNIWNLYCPTSVYQRSHTMLAPYHRLREHWLSLEGHCGRLFRLRTHTVGWKILWERSPWCRVDLIQNSFWKCSSKGRYCNSGNPHKTQWVIQCTVRHRQVSSLILLLSVRILIPDWCTEHRVQYERRCLKTDPLRTGRRVLSFLLWRNKILVVWIDIVLFMCAAAFLVVGIVQLRI